MTPQRRHKLSVIIRARGQGATNVDERNDAQQGRHSTFGAILAGPMAGNWHQGEEPREPNKAIRAPHKPPSPN